MVSYSKRIGVIEGTLKCLLPSISSHEMISLFLPCSLTVAGMGADLFESFCSSIIAALTLANGDLALVMLPFWVTGAGVFASILGFFAVRTKNDANQKQLLFALHKGTFISAFFVLLFSAAIVYFLFVGRESEGWRVYGCLIVGQVDGIIIGQITEYFTSYHYYPTRSIADAGVTGPATVIIQGLGIGMISCVFPVLVTVATILICDSLADEYGVAMAAVGMLATLGLNVASDTYGAISDNAGGIAEMAHLDERVREVTDNLDALGNTTAATGKGFAMGSAVLTALSLLAAFKDKSEIDVVDIGDPIVLSGALIGAMLPFLFSAMTMLSVQRVSQTNWIHQRSMQCSMLIFLLLFSRLHTRLFSKYDDSSMRFPVFEMEMLNPIPIDVFPSPLRVPSTK